MKEDMKIGYYVRYFPYKNRTPHPILYAGPEVVAYHLAVNMAKRGHEVNIFTTSIDRRDSIEKYENVTIYRYAKSFSIGHSNISFGLFKKPLTHQVEIVHAHGSGATAGFAAMQYPKRKNIPFVLTHHSDLPVDNHDRFIRRMGMFFYKKYLMEKLLSYVDIIISPSEYFTNESRFLEKYRDKVVVIPNGINTEEFNVPYSKEECREELGLPIDENMILFVGSLTTFKGPDVLLKAMPQIIKEVPDAKLVFVGSGKMRRELDRLCKKLGVEKYVKFAGFVGDHFKKLLYYKSADVFVLSSFAEVFPIVLLEASASGLPMVVSDLDTFKCIIEDGSNGIVTKRGDEKNLADAIIYLLENEDVREKMGKNARKKVEDYSWERIAEETEKVYIDVMNRREF